MRRPCGDPKVFKVMDRVKPLLRLIWQSVDVNEPADLDDDEALYAALVERQESERPRSPVEVWAEDLDLHSHALVAIRNPAHGFGAKGLYDLFVRQTGSPMSNTAFAAELKRLATPTFPNVPFGYAHRKSGLVFYPLKPEYLTRKGRRAPLALVAPITKAS
jgi:hypothetical protein